MNRIILDALTFQQLWNRFVDIAWAGRAAAEARIAEDGFVGPRTREKAERLGVAFPPAEFVAVDAHLCFTLRVVTDGWLATCEHCGFESELAKDAGLNTMGWLSRLLDHHIGHKQAPK